LNRWAVAIVAAVVALGIAACGGSSPSPTATPRPPETPSGTGIVLQSATLSTDDFSDGASADSPLDVPDLTSVKCTPNSSTGVQGQYKSEITAKSGRIYGNVVVGFDKADDAHAFMTQYFTGAQSCSDASSQPVQDTFGTYSFYYSIHGSPNDLTIEALQVDRYVSVVIQYLPTGTAGDLNSLRALVQASLVKLQHVTP
jgi:hypothetical protein